MIAIATLLSLLPLASGSPTELVESRIEVPTAGTWLALRDMDGDGRNDLVRVDRAGIEVTLLGEDGRFASEPAGRLPWPASNLGWDFADLDGDGAHELVVLQDSTRVRAWRLLPRIGIPHWERWGEGET